MIRIYPDEIFKEIEIDYPLKFRYAVSNRGRLISFSDKFETGKLLIGACSDGYRTLRYSMRENGKIKGRHIFVYKLVAQFFIPKTSDEQQHVLHLDFSRDNDIVQNLKWATYDELQAHRKKSPHVINAKRKLLEHNLKSDGRKLTITKVIYLKKLLQDPNRKTRLKMLAKQFGISEMQVCRIKSGENWGYIKV
ncbi:MAG: hypothetical protein H7199_06925 [Burkholderiales bacterium]|nr:hypothetical protein [Flavobacterium sp.]